jgi:hypothetical protein
MNGYYISSIKTIDMKKLYLAICLTLLVWQAGATVSGNDFSYDEAAFATEMEELIALEQEVISHDFTLTDLRSQDALTTKFASLDLAQSAFGIDDMDWGAFAWGFCCWPIGFFVVAINSSKTNDQKLSFWIGMGTSVVISAISSIATLSANSTTLQ